jgi:acetoacetyl-CoA synthetase
MTPLWTPSPEQVTGSAMGRLTARVGLPDSVALHRWSVMHPSAFWNLVWDDAGVVGERGTAPALDEAGRWFADARLSCAENLLGHAPAGDEVAVVAVAEDGRTRLVTGGELRAEVAAAAEALRHDGVAPGDRVAAWMPNVVETLVLMLATNAVGAVFTSSSPDFGPDAVADRFSQVTPSVLLAAPAYRYGGATHDRRAALAAVVERLPSLRRVVTTGTAEGVDTTGWDAWLAPHRGAPLRMARLPFDHPGFILYSSGTTGMPKCIVHRAAGVLLMHLKEHRLHCDVRPGDRVLYFTTCGWMMWNWLVSALASGACVVLYDGSPTHPHPTRLFDEAERLGVTLLGVSAAFLDASRRAGVRPRATHDLRALRTICSTGSPLGDDGFRYVYDDVAPQVHLASISGGTDLCGCFVLGDPTRPVHAGQIQGPGLGMDVAVLDDEGQPCRPGRTGELVCRPRFPTVPLGFWGDDDGSRFRAAYFERYEGWWHHGDLAEWTPEGGMVIHGRSDATLNASGVRIGTAEITRVVERFPEVAECMAVAQQWEGASRVVLLVRLAEGRELDGELQQRIRQALRTAASPRHVPARMVAVGDLPRTRSGKLSELAATDAVNGRAVRNLTALANPESLDDLPSRAELRR